MRFDYDPNFVEQAAFLSTRRNSEQECAMHEWLDPLYRIHDVELRRRAFRSAHGELFRQFGLDQIILRAVDEFPLLAQNISCCLVREADRARAQSVDLYSAKSSSGEASKSPTLIIALCPESLLDSQQLTPWLCRQLQHVSDMVDEQFGYNTELPAVSPVQQNLIRDRYAVLWDIYVESRLIRTGRVDSHGIGQLWKLFSKAFRVNGQGATRHTFEKLLNAVSLTHKQLLSWAENVDAIMEIEEGESDVQVPEIECIAVC